jgi:hypothetical protein
MPVTICVGGVCMNCNEIFLLQKSLSEIQELMNTPPVNWKCVGCKPST